MVSGAYGGFSNIWGAQIMPFSKETFDRWPISLAEMEPHYRIALSEMTLAGEEDDLAELFPLMVPARRLPPLADRTETGTESVPGRAGPRPVARHHPRPGPAGLPIRRMHPLRPVHDRVPARAHLFELPHLRPSPVRRSDHLPAQHARRPPRGGRRRAVRRGAEHKHRPVGALPADRIFVACGGIGTTRLVLGSLGMFDRPVYLQESVQFVMPTVSLRPVADPRRPRNFTLNQFNLLYDDTGDGVDLCQVHFYDYNPAFLASAARCAPPAERRPCAGGAAATDLRWSGLRAGLGVAEGEGRRASAHPAGLTSCPRWRSTANRATDGPRCCRRLVRSMLQVAPALDLGR